MAEACNITHLCLSNSDQVEAAIRGTDGILAGGKPGLVVIDCSTSNPVSTTALAAELEAGGMVLVDAPLGRTPKEAEAGTLDAMVGLPPEAVRQVIGWSRLSNGFFETFMKYAVDRDRNAHVFSISNASKDVRYAAAMASEAGVVNVIGAAVKHYFTHAEAIGERRRPCADDHRHHRRPERDGHGRGGGQAEGMPPAHSI